MLSVQVLFAIGIKELTSGGSDYNYIWEQGKMNNAQYYITYLQERAIGNVLRQKYIKKIYDISNLPNMPLIDTIITEKEKPI